MENSAHRIYKSENIVPGSGLRDCPYTRIIELRRGDILVKPNHNWIPGTSVIPGGRKFGHAAIVIEGASDTNIERLPLKAVIFESQARDVPPEFQLRKVSGYLPGNDFRFANYSFGEQNAPFRYRLHPNLTSRQIDSVIIFIIGKDKDESGWRAMKKFKDGIKNKEPVSESSASVEHWYCSLLIWQAYYEVLGIDLDANGGAFVFPNDLIINNFFDNTSVKKENRVRF